VPVWSEEIGINWVSHGQQLRADLNQIKSGFSQVNQATGQSGKQLGYWGQQMRALGTTIRYALAGSVVYGVITAISSLSQFQVKLGEIDAIATQVTSSGKLKGVGNELENLGTDALKMSVKFGLAVTDVQEYMRSFYSAFDAPSGKAGVKQASGLADMMSQFTVAAGADEMGDPKQMIAGISALMGGKYKPKRGQQMGSMLYAMLQESPTLWGQDVATSVGQLAPAKIAGRMTPEQIFAVLLQASKAGGSPGMITQNVRQLLTQSLVAPKSAASKAMMQQYIGTSDPNQLYKIGEDKVLKTLLRVLGGNVKVRNPKALNSADFTTDQDVPAMMNAAGVSGGANLTAIYKLFPRLQSARAFLNLIATGGAEGLEKAAKLLVEAEKKNTLGLAARRANDQRYLLQFASATKAVSVQSMRGLNFILKPAAKAGTSVVQSALKNLSPHELTGIEALLAGGGITAMLLKRAGKLGKGASRGVGLAQAELIGGGISGAFQSAGTGARAAPFWVIIDPISWYMSGAPSGGSGPNPGGKTIPPVGGFWKSGWGKKLGRVGGSTAAIGVLDAAILLSTPGSEEQTGRHGAARRLAAAQRFPLLNKELGKLGAGKFAGNLSMQQQLEVKALESYIEGKTPAKNVENWLKIQRREARQQTAAQKMIGEAVVTINLKADSILGKAVKNADQQVTVPVTLWPWSGAPAGTYRGKKKTSGATNKKGGN